MRRWLPGVVLLGALVVVVARRFGEEEHFARLLRAARPAYLLVAAGCQVVTYAVAAAVWQLVLRRSGRRGTFPALASLALEKLTIDHLMPTWGMSGKLLVYRAMRRRGVPTGIAAWASLEDLLSFYGAHAAAVLASAALLWHAGWRQPAVLASAVAFVAVAASLPATVLLLGSRGRVLQALARRSRGVRSLLDAVDAVPRGALTDVGLLLGCAALQLTIFALDAATLAALARAVGSDAGARVAFTSVVLGEAAATISMIPGGLGSFEAATIALLGAQHVPVEAALAATLLFRGFTLWLPLVPGTWLARRELAGRDRSPGGPAAA